MFALLKLGQVTSPFSDALVLADCISELRDFILSFIGRSGLSCTESPNATQIPLYS